MAEKEKDRRVCLDISSRGTIPSLACRLEVPNFFTLPEYEGAVFKSPTFQFADAFWFFEFLSHDRWQRKEEAAGDVADYRELLVNLVRLNSVIQQEIYSSVTLLNANDKKHDYDWHSSLFEEHENKFGIANFYNDDNFVRRETLCLIIQLFCEKSVVPDNDEILHTTNGDFETETTIEEKQCKITLELSTRKSISTVVCTLKIPNFFLMTEYDGTTFESRTIAFGNAAWCFRFFSSNRWKSEDDIDYKEIYFDAHIVRLDSEIPEQRIFYTIAILENNGQQYFKITDWDLFEDGCTDDIKLRRFWHENSCFDRRDSLTLIIRLFYDKPTQRGIERLVQNMKSLLLNGQGSDVMLKVEDDEFEVHKGILNFRSPVFSSMFQHDTKENATGIVDIPDCSAAAFKVFLLYLYTGSVDVLTSNNVFEVYYVADKYQVNDLKSECVEFMESNLSVKNFCELMTLSLQHNETNLQEKGMKFFCDNVKKIIRTVQWQKYMRDYPTEANELYIKAVDA